MRDFHSKVLYGGLGTVNGSRSPLLVTDQDIIDCDNLTFERDNWEKVGGADKINATAITGGPSITGQHEWVSDAGVRELVVSTSDGKLVTLNAGGIDKTLATGIGTNRIGVFAEGSTGGSKRLFFVNGSTDMLMYDGGASAVAIGSPPADWTTTKPTWAVAHEGRLWAGCDNHFIYGSVKYTHDDFQTTSGAGTVFFQVHPGEGEGIVGAASKWRRLFLFKYPLGVFYLDDSDANSANWTTPRHGRNVGSLGHRSILEAVDDVFFASPQGFIHALSAVQEYGDVKTSAILPLEIGPIILANVDFTRGRNAQSMYYGAKRKAYWCFTSKGSFLNDFILGLDFHNPNAVQAFLSRRDICESLGVYTNPQTNIQKPAAGDDQGFLWELETETFDKDGAAYNGLWETDDVELYPNGNRRANLRELEIVFDQSGNWDLDVDVIVDGVLRETKQFSLQGAGAVLGAFILGTDVLGILALNNSRSKLHGDGRRVRLIGRNGSLGESFRIVSQEIKYLPGNTK